jgi:hypothetical protein
MKSENVLIKVGLVMIILLSIFFSLYAVKHDEEQVLLAKQIAYEKWSQNNLFMNTLERYNEIYHRLDQHHDKKALALAYVEMITTDLFVFPSKRSDGTTISVLLPAPKEPGKKITDNKPYVLKEIYISFDNGIHDALKYVIDGHKGGIRQPPAFWSLQTGQLLEYVKTGNAAQLLPLGAVRESALAGVQLSPD